MKQGKKTSSSKSKMFSFGKERKENLRKIVFHFLCFSFFFLAFVTFFWVKNAMIYEKCVCVL